MRELILAAALISTPVMAANQAVMHRDPGCGCCEKWAAQVRKVFGRSVKIIDNADRPALQRKLGIPSSLASCHTAVIDGLSFEGHVPLADVKRVLAERPRGVRGLAVAGMPIGSPGMEVPGRVSDRYNVMAFGANGTSVYARR